MLAIPGGVLASLAWAQQPSLTPADVDVRYVDGRLSLVAHHASLSAVLDRIGEKVCLHYDLPPRLAGLKGSWTIEALPLQEALLTLARPDDVVLSEDRQAAGRGSCVRLVLVEHTRSAADQPAGSPPGPPTAAATAEPEPAESLGRRIGAESDSQLRSRAIAELAARPPEEATRGLDAALSGATAEVRADVARALGSIGGGASTAALGRLLLGDADASVRQAAAETLAALGDPASRALLKSALQDKDEGVRAAAAAALADD